MSEIPIQRYEMIAVTRCGEGWQELQREPEGDWVTYADHLKELEGLRNQRNFLDDRLQGREHELEELRAQLRSKDEQLAGMRDALKAAEVAEAALIRQWADFWDVAPDELIDEILKAQGLRNSALYPTGQDTAAALSGPSPAQD